MALRKFGQEIIEGLAKERIHPSWIVPGGVNAPLGPGGARAHSGRPARGARHRQRARSTFFKGVLDRFAEEIANFGTDADDVRRPGGRRAAACEWYDGRLQFKDADGGTVAADIPARRLRQRTSAKRRCAIPI